MTICSISSETTRKDKLYSVHNTLLPRAQHTMNVQELLLRYGIKSRKSLYSRLDGLGISLAKDSNKVYATPEQIELLDQQDKHIKNGGTIKNFIPTTKVTVDNTGAQHNTQHSDSLDISNVSSATQHNTQLTTQYSTQTQLLGEFVQALQIAIHEANLAFSERASKMNPPDPLWYLEKLEAASAMAWELTTSQVKELIGVTPRCDRGKNTFKRGSFIFVKSGKIGRQTSWKVQKLFPDDNTV